MFEMGVVRAFTVAALLLAFGFWVPSGAILTDQASAQPSKPNIVFLMVDDLDARSIGHMPNLRSQIAEKGITFENAFVTTSLCCPSRASILRGQYSHNHRVFTNNKTTEGFVKFRRLGREKSTIATWLRSEGYRTSLMGKYFNGYQNHREYVPPGWTTWYGSSGGDYYNFFLNENGKVVRYKGPNHYYTDVLSDKATNFVNTSSNKPSPFFLYLAPKAPHDPATPALRHENKLSDAKLPASPSFNEQDVSDKPEWIRDNERLTTEKIKEIRELRRDRLRTMLAVDQMIGRLIDTLKANGQFDNTYFFFTSDNGYHMGEHRLGTGKWTAYEEDIRVPLIARGPGVPKDRTSSRLVLNSDFAPTFARLAGTSPPEFVDGRSFKSLLSGNRPQNWRSSFLVESVASPFGRPAFQAVRTKDRLYVEYATGEKELYDLNEDPYQLRNLAGERPEEEAALEARLEALKECSSERCRSAEN